MLNLGVDAKHGTPDAIRGNHDLPRRRHGREMGGQVFCLPLRSQVSGFAWALVLRQKPHHVELVPGF